MHASGLRDRGVEMMQHGGCKCGIVDCVRHAFQPPPAGLSHGLLQGREERSIGFFVEERLAG